MSENKFATQAQGATVASRRAFLGAMTAASYSRILGANERIQVGVIGYGLIGAQHVHDFKAQPDVDLAAICETYQPRLEQGAAACGGNPRQYRDFRKLYDDKDIQAVVVCTPDHWHALLTILACAAGKDVYVEKPMSLFVAEGRWMVNAARRYNRVVQAGMQQRSGLHYQKARELLRSGYIGEVHSARAASFRNVMPGFGSPPDGPPPNDLDYDMWLGPAPKRPYNPQRALYHFRWFWDYSGGQMTNLGAHELDIVQWFTGIKGPAAVSCEGGRFALQDNGDTPDTQDAVFRYGDRMTAVWSHREASAGRRAGVGLEFFGTKGSLVIGRTGFEVIPDMKSDPANLIPKFQGQPGGGPQRTETKPVPWIEGMKAPGSSAEQFTLHARNFLDCIKSRERPIADVEEGHRTATACHLANISLLTGRRIHWDAEAEQIVNDKEAAQMLVRPYRKPWDDVLRSLAL